jgi:AraC-like DNA-binding protein
MEPEGVESPFIYESELVRIGRHRCAPWSRAWREENPITTGPLMVFPSRAVWIEQADREAVVASANRVVFHNLGVPYQRSLIDQRGEDSIYVTFASGVFAGIMREIDPGASEDPERPFSFVHAPVDARSYLTQRRLARRILRGESVEAMEVEETMIELARELLRAGRTARVGKSGAARTSTLRAHRDLARAAEDVLARRFRERVTLSGLARSVHSSPYHLARVFRTHTGMSVHGYLQGLRLRAGLVALESQGGLSELGRSLGFSSHAHFTTAFKREFGVAPSEERAG